MRFFLHIKYIINIICCFRDSVWCGACVHFSFKTQYVYQRTNTCKHLLLDVRKFTGIHESRGNGAEKFPVCTRFFVIILSLYSHAHAYM